MTKKKPPEAQVPEQHDPYKLRSLDQILNLFDGGEFLTEVMDGYALGKSGDVAMAAKAEFKGQKKPASTASAYINDKGELTLYSPFLARMHQPVRDVTPHDPETGEVRDV